MKQTSSYCKQLLTTLLVLISTYSFAQEFYFTDLGEATLKKKDAKTILTLSKERNRIFLDAFLQVDENTVARIGYKKARIVNDSTLKITVKKEGRVAYKMKRVYKKLDDKTYIVKDYDNYGNVSFVGKASSFFPLVKNGWGTSFYDNGKIASTGIYNNNKLLFNENWTSTGKKTFSNAFDLTNVLPTVNNSKDSYLSVLANHIEKNIKRSYSMFMDDEQNPFRRHHMSVNFIVDTQGNVAITNIEGKFKQKLKEEIELAMNKTSGTWKPGYRNDLAVNTRLTLPLQIKAYNDFQTRSSDHINHWFFYNDIPVRLYRW